MLFFDPALQNATGYVIILLYIEENGGQDYDL